MTYNCTMTSPTTLQSKLRFVRADLSNPEHTRAIVELLNQYALDPMGGGLPLTDDTRAQLPAALAARSDYHAILARDGEHWIGLCDCFEGFSTFACRPLLNIHDVFVAYNYRGRGIAQQMIEHAELVADELGCCKMTLEVLSDNQAAKSSYRKLGFKPYQLDAQFGNAEFWHKQVGRDDADG